MAAAPVSAEGAGVDLPATHSLILLLSFSVLFLWLALHFSASLSLFSLSSLSLFPKSQRNLVVPRAHLALFLNLAEKSVSALNLALNGKQTIKTGKP